MKINKTVAIVVLTFGLLLGGLAGALWFSQTLREVNAAPRAQAGDDEDAGEMEGNHDDDDAGEIEGQDDDAGESEQADAPDQAGEDDDAGELEGQDDEAGESEQAVSPDQVSLTAAEAKAAAEKAYPGRKVLEVELESENGVVAYEVELDNGLELLIDPHNGDVLGVDKD